eukprot:gene14189-biopygen6438
MLSWEKEEYERAIRRGIVITDVNDNTGEQFVDARGELTRLCQDRLDKKFYLAGLSMRFMQMSTEKLVEYLQRCLQEVENFSTVLQGLTGFRTSNYVHSLMGVRAEDPKKSCVVSKYVLVAMSDRASLQFVTEARATLPNNPSWQGWVFELEVLVRLRRNKCLCVQVNDEPTARKFSASYIVTYDFKTNASGEYWRDRLVRHNTICIPTQWNNAAFDFVHIAIDVDEDRYDVTFFNATIAATHRFDYQYVAQFLEVLFPLPPGVKKRPLFKMLSWEKEEYERAIRRGIVITDVNDNTGEQFVDARGELTRLCQDRLDKKFYLAGLSMRFMQMSTEKLVEYLQRCLQEVENFSTVLQGLTGFRTSNYVHSLMGVRAEDPKKSCVVSKYVLVAMSDRASLQFVTEARATLPNNPSWQGWVFELEVLVRLRRNKCLCVQVNDEPTARKFSASYIVTYDFKTNASGEYWRDRLVRHNTICIPTQWNNAAFDFVHIAIDVDEDRYDVTFFNATIAATHRFDYQYVAQFLEVLFPLPPGVKKRPLFKMLSWEKEEYERAIRRGIVITDVNDNTGEQFVDARGELTRLCQDRLDKKFYLAGLSMRFMQMSTEKLVEYLQRCLQEVENFSTVLQGLTGFRTSNYVHSLMGVRAEDPKKSCVVSKYVLVAMSDRASLQFVTEARATLPNNPSWQGWVFELEVLVRLRRNKCLCVQVNDEPTARKFSASYIVTYDFKTNASGEYWRDRLVRHNTICIPTQWNNAAFDFVHIAIDVDEDRYDVTFFNATIAATHRFDYQYVAQFLEVLFPLPPGVKKRPLFKVRVAFIVVVPTASVSFECVQENKVSVQNYDGTFTDAITAELVCD